MDRKSCSYASCYCEENVYKLAEMLVNKVEELAVVFISNQNRTIPLFAQKSESSFLVEGLPVVIWDYHVILLERRSSSWHVWDLDSTTQFPCPAQEYYWRTVVPEIRMKEQYRRQFRVIPAATFLRIFSSNRSHMLREDGSYSAPIPSWPAIWKNEDTLQKMITMCPDELADETKIYAEQSFQNDFCS